MSYMQNSEHTNIVRTSSKVSTEQLVQEDPSHTSWKNVTIFQQISFEHESLKR